MAAINHADDKRDIDTFFYGNNYPSTTNLLGNNYLTNARKL